MKFWKNAVLVVCLSIFGFCFLPSHASGAGESVKLRYSVHFGPGHGMSVSAEAWAKEIEKRTDGRVKFTLFLGGTLTPSAQCYDSVVRGIADVGFSVLNYTAGRFPMMELFDMALGARSGVVAAQLINDFYARFKPKELDETKLMYLTAHGPALIHTKKPVNKLEDLQGLKVRTGGIAARGIAALGGTPVAMPMNEAYDAISRGVADANHSPFEALKSWKIAEVVKYTTEDYGASNSVGFFVVMNKKAWEKIASDDQKIIEKVNEEWIPKSGKTWDEADKEAKAFTLQLGNKIISLSPDEDRRWASRVTPLFDEYVKKLNGLGLPGDEALKFTREQLLKLQK